MKRFLLRFFPILIALALIAIIFLTCPPARAADISGQACSNLGTTQMTADRTGLVFCALKEGKESSSPVNCEENGGCVWKSMTDKAGSGVPVGAIIAWPVASNPEDMQGADGGFNWLDCNGQSVPSALYPELYKKIGAKVPDLRGLFLRGLGGNSATLLQTQQMDVQNHRHFGLGDGSSGYANGHGVNPAQVYYHTGRTGWLETSASILGVETRPVNMAVRYLIRARP